MSSFGFFDIEKLKKGFRYLKALITAGLIISTTGLVGMRALNNFEKSNPEFFEERSLEITRNLNPFVVFGESSPEYTTYNMKLLDEDYRVTLDFLDYELDMIPYEQLSTIPDFIKSVKLRNNNLK